MIFRQRIRPGNASPGQPGPALPGKKMHRPILLFFPLLLAAALLIFYTAQQYKQNQTMALVVYAPYEERIVESIPFKPGDTFTLDYIHSVSLTPVYGVFTITAEGRIKPLQTRFTSYGPGLPHITSSDHYTVENGTLIFFHQEEPREKLRLWVSALTMERLTIGELEIPLAPPGEAPLLLEIFAAAPQEKEPFRSSYFPNIKKY